MTFREVELVNRLVGFPLSCSEARSRASEPMATTMRCRGTSRRPATPSVRAGQVSSTSIVMGSLFRPIVREEGDFLCATCDLGSCPSRERPVETTGGPNSINPGRWQASASLPAGEPSRLSMKPNPAVMWARGFENSICLWSCRLEAGQGRALPVARAGPCNFATGDRLRNDCFGRRRARAFMGRLRSAVVGGSPRESCEKSTVPFSTVST